MVNGTLSEIEVIYFMFQLIQGLQYLQKKNIIHCDLKPVNLFIDDKLELKIADFGFVRKEKDDDIRNDGKFGTTLYMSPEMNNKEIGKLSNKLDIWALGVIMYHLLTGEFPIKNQIDYKVITKDYNLEIEFPEDKIISDEAKDLIKQILIINPEKRPNLSQILYHDFFHIDKLQEKISNLKQLKIEDIIKNKTNIEIIRNKNKKNINKENKFPCLKKLKINQIIEIKLQDIDTYVLKEQSENEIFPNQITYFHKSIHYKFYYYEENNGFIGVKYQNEDGGTHLLVDNEKEYFYNIIIDDADTEKIKIEKYKICDCPEKLKSRLDELFKYYKSRIKKQNKNKDGQNNWLANQQLVENNDKKDSKEEINDKKIFYIKEIKSFNKAYFLKLSDDTKQIKFYDDKSEIIMSDQKDSIIYQDRHKERSIIPFYNIMDNSSEEVISRIEYIREKTIHEMNEKIRKKFEKLVKIRRDKNNEDIFNS